MLAPLTGYHSIGHTRYSTTGSNAQRNIQPFLVETMHGPLAVAHNGNIVNATALRDELLDARLRAHRDERHRGDRADAGRRRRAARGRSGSSARCRRGRARSRSCCWPQNQVIAVRDPWGFRPLSLGRLPHGGYAVASETCALSTLGCVDIDEVQPGEIVTLQGAEMRRHQALTPAAQSARCTFEFVYFSRPDSVWDGHNVHHVRQRLGVELAQRVGGRRRRRDPRARLLDPRRDRVLARVAASRSTTG